MLDQKGRAKWDHWNGKKGAQASLCGTFVLGSSLPSLQVFICMFVDTLPSQSLP